MNVGALLIYASVYVEKGIALIIPGYTPDSLGQIYTYTPSATELRVACAIFGFGFLFFTILVRIAIFLLFEKKHSQDLSADTVSDEVVAEGSSI